MDHNEKGYQNMLSSHDFLSSNNLSIDMYPDLLVRLDLLLVKIANHCKDVKKGVAEYWEDYFPEIDGDENIFDCLKTFLTKYRRTLFDIITGVQIGSREYRYTKNVERLLIRYLFILNTVNSVIDIDLTSESLFERISDTVDTKWLVDETVEICMMDYFGSSENNSFSDHAVDFINSNREELEYLIDKIRDALTEKKRRSTHHNIFSSKYNIVRIENVLEKGILLRLEGIVFDGDRKHLFETMLKNQWDNVFECIPYTKSIEEDVLYVIKNDDYLSALKTLFIAGTINDIQKPYLARRIAYLVTLKYVIVQLINCTEPDTLVEEVLNYASRLNFVGISEDEEIEIVEKLVQRYCSNSDEVDSEIISYILAEKDQIIDFYTKIKKSFNSRFSSKTIDEKNRIITELQNQVEQKDIASMRKMLELLTDSNRGSVLNNLYRFAKGYDTCSLDYLRDNINGLFYIISQIGISAAYEEIIDTEYVGDSEYSKTCKCEDREYLEDSNYIIKYPGWKINDQLVVPPISVRKNTR